MIPTVYPDKVYCYQHTDDCPRTCAAGERTKAIRDIPNWLYPRLIWRYLKSAGCCPAQSAEENERLFRTVHPEAVRYYLSYYEANKRREDL